MPLRNVWNSESGGGSGGFGRFDVIDNLVDGDVSECPFVLQGESLLHVGEVLKLSRRARDSEEHGDSRSRGVATHVLRLPHVQPEAHS